MTEPSAPTSTPKTGVLAAGTILAGRYKVESLLGSGGTGSVYRVQHTFLLLEYLEGARLRDELEKGPPVADSASSSNSLGPPIGALARMVAATSGSASGF